MIWNGFLFGIGLVLASIVVMIVFGLLGLLGVVFGTISENIAEKKWFEELNKYNWKNRKKKE